MKTDMTPSTENKTIKEKYIKFLEDYPDELFVREGYYFFDDMLEFISDIERRATERQLEADQKVLKETVELVRQTAKEEVLDDIIMEAALAQTSARTEQERWDRVMESLKALKSHITGEGDK